MKLLDLTKKERQEIRKKAKEMCPEYSVGDEYGLIGGTKASAKFDTARLGRMMRRKIAMDYIRPQEGEFYCLQDKIG